MGELAGWIGPIATAIAAIMTASNLGARVTGWGFVIFAIGSVAWITVATSTGQTNLLLMNGFLTFVNIMGIWRWLGRQATYDRGAKAAEAGSEVRTGPDLFQLAALPERAVSDRTGQTIGHVVDAMVECGSGRIAYLVIREGSEAVLTERLHALPWNTVQVDAGRIRLKGTHRLEDMPETKPDLWPARCNQSAVPTPSQLRSNADSPASR